MDHIVNDHVLVKQTRIAHGVHGVGDPVVLVHGTPSSSLIWRNVVPYLVDAGFKVHVFDLLGYGLSERPWDPAIDTSISAQVPVLEAMLDHWGLEAVHLIAHDIGGGIAQRFGVFSPHRLRSLSMIDVVSYDSYPSHRTREQMKAGLEALITAPDEMHRAHFKEWLLSTVTDKKSFSDGPLNLYLDFISGPIGQGSLYQHQVRHYDPKHTLEIADQMHELGGVPTKLIWGADDGWQVLDWAHRLKEAIPNAELSVIENCGHFAMEDQPDEVSKLLLAFLNANR